MTDLDDKRSAEGRTSPWELAVGPKPEQWDDWVELDPRSWPKQKERHYRCIPTICFNCESACGLLAFVDKETGETQKFEGNPVHPGSRGRTCAKGPATINQVRDTERILKPLKRKGPRGGGEWEEVSWEAALEDIGGRIAKALDEERHDEIMYHVGRPGEDNFALRMLQAWGIDGHNSHTNVCSASARLGFSLWLKADRPSPDYSQAKFALLLSAHLETGHYFNPHAQRIIDAKTGGMRIAVVDTRLSNTTTHADHWISPWPGTEAALLLGIARELLESNRIDAAFVEQWTNWKAFLAARDADGPGTFERFLELLRAEYSPYTDAFVTEECKIPPGMAAMLADEIAAAGSQFTSHLWRNTAAGNLGGWQTARSLLFLHVLTGSVGTPGGFNPNSWDKFVPKPSENPEPNARWNEALWPKEYPLAHYEMSFLLPHLLRDQDAKVDVYFTRVYNPVWTNPDGCSWVEMFSKDKIGLHVALTPTWSETAQWADYVLPMGLASERHDIMSQETHAGTWIGFRQPVGREFTRLQGGAPDSTLGTNPGEVWEETEFWTALTWRIDPDGSRGIRRFFESKEQPGEPVTMDEYFADVFQNVPGLPERARQEGLNPLEFMRRRGAYEVPYAGQERYAAKGKDGKPEGFHTPSKKLEFYSPTLSEWGFDEHAIPGYIRSQVNWRDMDFAAGERALLPTFRLPTLIHTRSANAKWLQEISHTNPLWIHPEDAEQLGIENGGLVRVSTRIGHFVPRAWVTEGIHPGVVACSHHVGRWKLFDGSGNRYAHALVRMERGNGKFLFRNQRPVGPSASSDPDSSHIFWDEAGVNQNLTFPVQPDPVSGMHCWHQKVTVAPAHADDRYADVYVDTKKSVEVYEEWRARTRPAPGPGGLRRPLWMNRPLRPTDEAYGM
ncbi:MAG: molybdopterin-dependent oxidoreductase [bacterium]|nr:molybdopterin-dependent oxidoreductase [bacterium]